MMLSQKLIKVIQDHATELSRQWLEEVRSHPTTPTYHSFADQALLERVHNVYANLGKWLGEGTTEIERYYTDMGMQRYREGFRLSEVLSALFLTKRILWDCVMSEGLMDSALSLYQTLELDNRVVLFFDKAAYYVAVGYEKTERR